MSPKKKEDFINPKIVVREVAGKKLNCCFDDSGYFTNDTTHMIRGIDSNSLKYILTIINSNLIGWYFRKFYGESNDLFPKIKVNELKDLPIKTIESKFQKQFVDLADRMLLLNKDLHSITQKFSIYFSSQYKIEKLSGKLANWSELDFLNFCKELNAMIKTINGSPLTKKMNLKGWNCLKKTKRKPLTLKPK